jgi:hypothetical protein
MRLYQFASFLIFIYYDVIEKQLRSMLLALGNMKDENRLNELSSTLFDSGILKIKEKAN